ncbi:d-3-phosphoglycerate dehydrogenase [Cordyceps fumosorosea ARSEF 2679]|uniref:phosphoglycerate dehydrogenase n=1 Tax=Cordyceps fumosorosea (strain ARSEF 2679) TaxID=1081104 RepID=A0A162JKG5_CORFA|nr:d-3-phosphoglycerate dehydrogenase [Cordyceps fumosorosea ARSEF 2679]OAA70302.1 d-3-phosphoglycerate dehydrogenase [Cordyceps fumosorosea ARSEF 2679]
MDVCTQVLEILRGGLPTSAVNAPIILPEQYRKLQPSVALVEKMGRLYSQHFAGGSGSSAVVGGRTFELVYHGELAGMPNTKPLLAALVKGLVASFSDSNVNIVNATQIAKEKGITVSETHAHDSARNQTYVNLVSLRSYPDGSSSRGAGAAQVIEGYASNKRLYISRLGRFNAAFSPEGTLIILHNYDQPGKIGGVGTVLGSHGINIRFMQVAALSSEFRAGEWTPPTDDGLQPSRSQDSLADVATQQQRPGDEALMILGIAGNVDKKVMDDLQQAEGVLDVSVVNL